MSETLNATCAICGKKYHVCNACKDTKIFKPWRTITDTIECYKIYMIVHDYKNRTIRKNEARELLEKCNMPDYIQPHIKNVIDEIMYVRKQSKNTKPNDEVIVAENENNE